MVQPAKDRMRNNVSGPLDWARVGRVLPERNVSSHVIIQLDNITPTGPRNEKFSTCRF